MRIAFVTTSFRPYEWRSGISNVVYLLAKEMQRRGLEVKVFSPLYKGLARTERKNGISVERFEYTNNYFAYSPKAAKLIVEFSPDIVHSFHYGFYPATAGLKAANALSTPHVFTPAYHPPIYSPAKRLAFKAYDSIYGKKLVKSSKLIVFSNNEKKQMAMYGAKDITVIPAPVNNDIFYPRKRAHPLTIAYAGSFLPWKGAGIAMDIFKQLGDDIRFFFIGGGPMYKNLKRRGGKNFKFFLEQPTQRIAKIYNACDIFLSPTYYESFGCAIAEAAMCGLPAVSTRVGAVPETVGGGGLLVDYGDWAGMKIAVDRLLEDGKLRRRLATNAINHSRNYRYKDVTASILKSYKKLL